MDDAMDVILERLRGTGVEVRGTVQPNHVPMAAEAMCALGHPDQALAWASRARERLVPIPRGRGALTPADHADALGRPERLADWLALFRGELAELGPFATLSRWAGRLLPGVLAGGGHALIRTAHAVRSLESKLTPLRLDELALSLAYWAAEYRPLPGTPLLRGAVPLEDAVRALPRIATPETRTGAPREFVLRVSNAAEFGPTVEAAAGPEDADQALTAISSLGVRLYLSHADQQPLVFLHAVTLPAAVSLLLPHLHPADRRPAVAYAWQASAAWISAYDDRQPPAPPPEHPAPARDLLIERALHTRDAHAAKLTEACLRLHARTGDRAYLDAAADFISRLETAAHWTDAQRSRAGLRFD